MQVDKTVVASSTKEMACRWIRQRLHHLFGAADHLAVHPAGRALRGVDDQRPAGVGGKSELRPERQLEGRRRRCTPAPPAAAAAVLAIGGGGWGGGSDGRLKLGHVRWPERVVPDLRQTGGSVRTGFA